MDEEALVQAAIIESWAATRALPIDEEAQDLRDAMTRCCDAAMPRIRENQGADRRNVYWWSDEIAQMRRETFAAKRNLLRLRRRRAELYDPVRALELRMEYATRKRELRATIAQAKAQAWDELLATLDHDPWGMPFRIVRKKLKGGAGTVTEALDAEKLDEVLTTLFPGSMEEEARPRAAENAEERPDDPIEVTEGELKAAVRAMRRRGNTAPGPDGIHGTALALAMPHLGGRLRALFGEALTAGRFPTAWKTGRLVLLEKPGRAPGSPGAYRPLCILDEAGKLLERVIVERLLYHLRTTGPDLGDRQYGFRRGRSTIDAIKRVIDRVEEATVSGRVAVGVSLDIENAFNSIPTEHIAAALARHNVPRYLQETIADYFSGRGVEYRVKGRNGTVRRTVTRGVPQGSVLGPIMWDLAYDPVVRDPIPLGLEVVCFADDTFAVATGSDWKEAIARAQVGAGLLVGRITALGLRVALEKSEAVGFPGRRRAPRAAFLAVDGSRIPIGGVIRYLGLRLDGRLTFAAHFQWLHERLLGVIGAYGQLMPNLHGPGDRGRRMYLAVVASVVMYGAPIWYARLGRLRSELRKLHSRQRMLNNRAIRGYRSIGFAASCAIAGSLPWEIRAEIYGRLYEWRVQQREAGICFSNADREREKGRLWELAIERWTADVAVEPYGRRSLEAIGPRLKEWCGRPHGQLKFHLVQLLSGHGCFGRYLCKVAKSEPTERCHHCDSAVDSAEHTIVSCPAWEAQRGTLCNIIGDDLSLPMIVEEMLQGKEEWEAVEAFALEVLTAKEAAERTREEDPNAHPVRRKKRRRRRAAAAPAPRVQR